MRIGILTFHDVVNYGAYLQAFSLSNQLQEQFPNEEVEIIDYIAPKAKGRKLYVLLWSVKHYGIRGGWEEMRRIFMFRSMQPQLRRSPKSFCANDLKKFYSYIDQRYDALIIGSDAVFNWHQTNFPTAFIPDYHFTIPVLTYAASVHGMPYLEEPKERIEMCRNAFRRMDCVGVRDRCSEQFVEYCCPEAKVLHCCDPTFFINKKEISSRGKTIEEKLQKKYGFSLNSKYLVVMAPDSTFVSAVAKKYGSDYKIVSVFVKSSHSDYHLSDLNPFEWAYVLKNASAVITSYFHGTLLSLVQGTPAIVLDYSGFCDEKYEGKLRDLMFTRLSLPEFYRDKNWAEDFKEDEEFDRQFSAMLEGHYQEAIEKAVLCERQTFNLFLERLKETLKRKAETNSGCSDKEK